MRESDHTTSGDRSATTAPGGECGGGSVFFPTPDRGADAAGLLVNFKSRTPGHRAAPQAFDQAFKYARYQGLQWHDAEDFASEIVIEVLGMDASRFDSRRGPISRLIATVNRRRMANRLRREIRYGEALKRFEEKRAAERLAEEPPEIAAQREQVTALHEAIVYLPPELFEVMSGWLRGEHLTQRAYAQSLGKSTGWVSKRLRQARAALAESMGSDHA